MKKSLCIIIALVLAFAFCLGSACNKNGSSDSKGNYAGTVNGIKITRAVFGYAYNYSANELYYSGKVSFDGYGSDAFVELLKSTKNEDGKTYFDVLADDTIEHAQRYLVNESLARESDSWPSDSELKSKGDDLETEINSTYSYYIQYGYTADSICMSIYGLPMEDYKEIYPRVAAVEDFNTAWKSELHPSDETLEQFYNDHIKEYRVVTVRHSLIDTREMTEAEKAEALATAQQYVDAVRDGTMTFDEVVNLSDDTGVTSNSGYYDVYENSGFVKAFEDWAVACETTTEIPEIVETEYGYHLMICTAITGYEDDNVQSTVDAGWRTQQREDHLDQLGKESKYAVADKNQSVIEKFTRMYSLMNFEDSDDEDTDPTEQATATPKPEYDDAPMDDSVVAKVGDMTVLYPELVYMFGSAVTEIVSDDITFDDDATTAERYQHLREFLDSEYQDSGKTYLEKIKEYTLEQLLEFKAAYMIALENKTPYTDDELAAMNDEIDETIDYYLTYAGEYYGVTTRDEYMTYVTGMNVNEYKYFNAIQSFLSDYAETAMEEMNPSEEVLKEYYEQNIDYYRVVSVRHIYLAFTDSDEDGNISEEEKASVQAQAQALIDKIVIDGDSPEAIVRAWSQADDATTTEGVVDISAVAGKFTDEINEWAIAQTTVGIDTIRTFETEDGVEIVYIAGILTFDNLEGVTSGDDVSVSELRSTLETAYKNEQYDKMIKDYIAEKGLVLTEVNDELVNKAVEDYLTYNEVETVTE